jgi:hypothetical protein
MKNLTIITIALLILSSCATKNAYVKQDFSEGKPKIEHVLLLIDFTSLKDDIGKIWDFDEDYNIKQQDSIHTHLSQLLVDKGYDVLPKNLKTSGLLLDPNLAVEHYKNKSLQQSLISAPFIVRSVELNDNELNQLTDLFYLLNGTVSPKVANHIYKYRFATEDAAQLLSQVELPENTAVLVITANRPKISAMKNIGIGLLSAGLVLGASGGTYVGISTLHGIPSTFGYFIDAKTGQLLWTNYAGSTSFKNSKSSFIKDIPAAIEYK